MTIDGFVEAEDGTLMRGTVPPFLPIRTVEDRLDAIEADIAAVKAIAEQVGALLAQMQPILDEAKGNPVKLIVGLMPLFKNR